MRDGIPIPELKARLNEGLPQVLFDVLSNAKPDGRNRWKGSAPNGDKIVVETSGPKRGYVFNTTGSGCGDGNLFNLIVALHCNGNRIEACRFSERILGLDPNGWQPDPVRAEHVRQEERRAAEESEKARRARFEAWLQEYRRGTPQAAESPSGRYLVGRACPLSAQLRDAQSLYDGTPVMLAPMVDTETLAIKAIHVTKLAERECRVFKSSVDPVKFTVGYPRGCLIPLCDGKSGLPLREAFAKDLKEAVVIGEGIETSLSAQGEFPELRLFAAGSVGNLANLTLPRRFVAVVLLRDHDDPSNLSPAMARKRAIERWQREGRRVFFVEPPKGFKDLNDAAQAFAKR
jgi:hypothetical protein